MTGTRTPLPRIVSLTAMPAEYDAMIELVVSSPEHYSREFQRLPIVALALLEDEHGTRSVDYLVLEPDLCAAPCVLLDAALETIGGGWQFAGVIPRTAPAEFDNVLGRCSS